MSLDSSNFGSWKQVDEYCWSNGRYNICKIGSSNGMKYELWHVQTKVQLAVNLPNSKAAITAARDHMHANSNTQPQEIPCTTTEQT